MAERQIARRASVSLSEPQERLARQVATLLQRHYNLAPQNAFAEASSMVATVARSVFDQEKRGVPLFYDDGLISRGYSRGDRERLEDSLRTSWRGVYEIQRSQGFGRPQADSVARNFFVTQRFLPAIVPVRTAPEPQRRRAPARTYIYVVRVGGVESQTRTYRITSSQPLQRDRFGTIADNALLRIPSNARITDVRSGRTLSVGQFIHRIPAPGDPLATLDIQEIQTRRRQG